MSKRNNADFNATNNTELIETQEQTDVVIENTVEATVDETVKIEKTMQEKSVTKPKEKEQKIGAIQWLDCYPQSNELIAKVVVAFRKSEVHTVSEWKALYDKELTRKVR